MWRKQLDQTALQTQVQWKHPDRPVLKSWAILARNYNTKVMNYFELIMSVLYCSVGLLFYTNFVDRENWFTLGPLSVVAVFAVFAIFLVTNFSRAKKLFVYRLTAQGFEVASWKNNVERIKKFFIGICIFSFCACLMIVIIFPQAFFLLFVGPTGYVFISLSMMGNKDYWEWQKEFSHIEFFWEEATKIIIDNKRNIISFYYDGENARHQPDLLPIGRFNIFCHRNEMESLALWFRKKLINIPFVEDKANVSPATC